MTDDELKEAVLALVLKAEPSWDSATREQQKQLLRAMVAEVVDLIVKESAARSLDKLFNDMLKGQGEIVIKPRASTRCSAMLKTSPGRQCDCRATVERDGKQYCGTHDPEGICQGGTVRWA